MIEALLFNILGYGQYSMTELREILADFDAAEVIGALQALKDARKVSLCEGCNRVQRGMAELCPTCLDRIIIGVMNEPDEGMIQ